MSDWNTRSNQRRDERQTKVENIRAPSGGNSRNTKRWCRGKVGVPHEPVCVDYNEHKRVTWTWAQRNGWKLLVCAKCGHEIDRWWPSPWRRDNGDPPPWVK